MNGFVVARHINNITLNDDFEYLCDVDGKVIIFESEEEAQEFLKSTGYTDEEIAESIRFFTYDERLDVTK